MKKKLKRNTMLVWIITFVTFITTYLVMRFTPAYREIFQNEGNILYKNVLFEVGIVLFAALLVFMAGYYIYQFWNKKLIVIPNILAICILMVVTLIISILVKELSIYLMPVILIPLVLTFISDRRTAYIMTIVMTIAILPFVYVEPTIILMNLFTGLIACVLASKIIQRRDFPILGITLALCNILVLFAMYTIRGFDFNDFLKNAGMSAIITFVSVIATIGALPFFETLSGIISPFELVDLSNPTHKLLKRLVVEAPGTYYHSIMVGNLAEEAADKIGANPNLARVAAYYHDIGKLKEPLNFMENQHGENIHDTMNPYDSVRLITAHTTDGVKIAEKYRLPPQIVEIIGEHHGTTLVAWFYNKACEQAGGSAFIQEEDFRYKAQKPSTKESGIILLADSVEAATKALTDKSQDKIKERIDKVIDAKIADGQLDDCPLTIRDIGVVKRQFFKTINAYYHKRDEYPGTTGNEGENVEETMK